MSSFLFFGYFIVTVYVLLRYHFFILTNSTKPTSTYYGFLSHKLDVDTYQYRTSAGEVVQVTVTKVNPKDNVPCALIGTFVKTDGPPSKCLAK